MLEVVLWVLIIGGFFVLRAYRRSSVARCRRTRSDADTRPSLAVSRSQVIVCRRTKDTSDTPWRVLVDRTWAT